jgi:hypothetical protein
MDGVLCDYDYWIERVNGRKENGRSDWKKLEKIGSRFWSEMPWIEEGRKLYNYLLDRRDKYGFRLGILSAIHLPCGKAGKKEWLKRNCPEIDKEDIIICQNGACKYKYAAPNRSLIDDWDSICTEFTVAGGNAIQFTGDCASIINSLEQIFEKE